jgi:2-aminoethylphosphonate-pyruvate transaminase
VLSSMNDDLVRILGGRGTHECGPFVSSGTGANEAILNAVDGPLLVLVAEPYSQRIAAIAGRAGRPASRHTLEFPPLDGVDIETVARALAARPEVSHLFVAHHETTTGVLAPLHELGELCAARQLLLAVDGISSVGGHSFDLSA